MMREVLLTGGPDGVAELTRALAEVLDGSDTTPLLPLDARHPGLGQLRAAMAPDEPAEPATAVIITTSGSTGDPKGVLLSAAALRASAEATHRVLGGPGRWLVATPTQYIGGLQVLVRALLAGTRPGVVDLSEPFRADTFATAARTVLSGAGPYRTGPYYTAMVPTQLIRLLDDGGAGLAALRQFDAVILGAAATPATLRDRATAAGVRVVPSYGMSETASGCVYDGVPLPVAQVRLADEDAHGVGRVTFAGPMLAHGYRLRPEETARAFVDGWFTTGDVGRHTPDGRLEVLGRTDDMINTGGVKVPPVVVERVLAAQSGVREACVVGLPDARWGQVVAAAVVPTGATPPDKDELRGAVKAAVGRAAVPKRFRFVDQFPLRGPGKIDRATIRGLFDDRRAD